MQKARMHSRNLEMIYHRYKKETAGGWTHTKTRKQPNCTFWLQPSNKTLPWIQVVHLSRSATKRLYSKIREDVSSLISDDFKGRNHFTVSQRSTKVPATFFLTVGKHSGLFEQDRHRLMTCNVWENIKSLPIKVSTVHVFAKQYYVSYLSNAEPDFFPNTSQLSYFSSCKTDARSNKWTDL